MDNSTGHFILNDTDYDNFVKQLGDYRVKFYSNKLQKEVEAGVLETRKYTTVLILDSGKIIIKKNHQLLGE